MIMEYFILSQDQRMLHTVTIKDMSTIRGYHDSMGYDSSQLPPMSVAFINSRRDTVYTDLLDRQMFLISDNLRELFHLVDPEITYKHCCLLDRENDVHTFYHIPSLHVASDVAITRTEMVVFGKNAKLKHIFTDEKRSKLIVSLLVAESIMRRALVGIKLDRLSLRNSAN